MGFNGNKIFSNVSLNVIAGQIVTIVGDSGVGKSTMLRAIAGLSPFDGQILVDGHVVKSNGINTSTGPVVLVTQQPNLWDHLTALDNIALVRLLLHNEHQKVARSKSLEILRELEVHTIADRYPHSLSGGEQQRVSLARGFATEKPILLLDEVTSNIDHNRRSIVAKALLALAEKGRSILFVTHDLNTAKLVTDSPLELTSDGLNYR